MNNLKAEYAISLSKSDLASDEGINQRWYWTGWHRRHWPANEIRPGLLVYGFDGRSDERRLCCLLKITHGGSFSYRTKREFIRNVKELTGWRPGGDPHWDRIPFRNGNKPLTGLVVRWKLVKWIDGPRLEGRFPQLGWKRLGTEPINDVLSLDSADLYEEGGRVLRQHLAVERNPRLRAASKAFWTKHMKGRIRCWVCNFDFHKRYGEAGQNFIEMHHEKQVSTLEQPTRQGVKSLIPVARIAIESFIVNQ